MELSTGECVDIQLENGALQILRIAWKHEIGDQKTATRK